MAVPFDQIRTIRKPKPKHPVIPEIAEQAAAILATFGSSDAAVLDVLFGKFQPEGKLPIELPRSMEAIKNQKCDTGTRPPDIARVTSLYDLCSNSSDFWFAPAGLERRPVYRRRGLHRPVFRHVVTVDRHGDRRLRHLGTGNDRFDPGRWARGRNTTSIRKA